MRHRHTILVTGANGFVGTALTKYLVDDGTHCVRGATRQLSKMHDRVEGIEVGDISAGTNWQSALNGVGTVVHLAVRVHVMRENSSNPLQEFRRVNVQGTLALAEQAAKAGVSRFIFLSSVKVNGEAGMFTEANEAAPLDDYGITKHEAEIGLREIAQRTDMEVVIIRPPLVYGPGVKANFKSLQELVARRIPLPLASVQNKRSFVGLGNLTNFIGVAITNPLAANETFFVSDGNDLSTPQLVQAIARAGGKEARLFPISESVLMTAAALVGKKSMAQRLLGSLQVDIGKAKRLLNWTPLFSVEEELRRCVKTL